MKQFINKIKTHLVVPSLGFAILFSVFDIIVDVYIFKEGTVTTHLFSPQPLEIYYRSFVALMFIAFGFIGQKMVQRREKAEETLKVAENKFKIVAENTYDWEFWTGPDRKFIFTSPSSIRVTGYPPEKFNEDPGFLDSIIYPDDIAVYDLHRKEAELEHGLHEVEFRINHADGTVRWISHACQPVTGPNGEHLGIRGTNRDITARKRMEVELENNEKKYRGLFTSMLNGFALHKIIVDHDGHPVNYEFLEVNEAFERMTGLKRKDIVGRRVTEVIPGLENDTFDWIGTYGRVALKNDKMQFEQYSKALGKWYNISAYSPAKGEFATILEDITERKKIESVVRENQERMETIFNSIQAGIIVVDRETHTITYANQTAAKMVGATPNDIMDRPCHKFICPAESGACPITDLGQTVDNSEKCVLTITGGKIPILKTVVEAELDGRPVLVESFVDISERKRMETELQFRNVLLSTQQEASIEGILVVGENGEIISYNTRFSEMFGVPADIINSKEDAPLLEFVTGKQADPQAFLKRVQYLYAHKEEKSQEEIILKDGQIFERYSAPMIAKDGKYYGRVWYFRDITERKRAEVALNAEAIRRRIFIEQSRDGIVVLTKDGSVYESNHSFAEMIGYSPEEVKQIHVWDWEYQYTHEQTIDMIRNVSEAGDFFETRHRRKDGTLYDVEISTNGAFFEGEKLIFCVCRDITERKKQDKAIKEQALFFKTLIDTILNPVFYKDTEGKYLGCNKAFEELLGIPEEQIAGKTVFELTPPEKAKQYHDKDMELLENGGNQTYEYTVKSAKQGLREMQFNKSIFKDAMGNPKGIVGVMLDITERKQAEKELRKSEEKFRNLVENQSEGIGVTNEEEKFVFANPAADNIFGLEKGLLVGRSLKEYLTPAGIQQIEEESRQRKDGKRGLYELEINTGTGEKKIIYVSAIPQTDSTGKHSGTMGLFQDITERKQAEEKLRESEEKFRLITENTADTITVMDLDLKINYVSPSIQKLRGYTAEEAQMQSLDQIILPAYLPMVYKTFEEQMSLEERRADPSRTVSMELEEYCKDGTVIWVEVTMSFLRDKNHKAAGIVTLAKNITERRRAEKLQDALYHISEAAVKSENLDTLYGEIHKTVSELISARNFYIALYHEKEDMLSFPYFVDEVDPAPQPRKLAKGLTEYVLKTGTPLLASPVVLNLLIEQGKVSMVGTPAIDWAGVPLKVGNITLGVLVVQSYKEDIRFGAEALSMLNFVSDNIALAIARKNDEAERRKLVAELRKLSSAVEQSTSVIVIADLEGNIEYANRAFEKTTGYSMEEAAGKNPRILKSGETTGEEYKRLWETIAGGGEWRGQFHNKRKDGSLYWEQAAISGIRDAEGKVVKYLAVKEDITERKMMEDELKASETQNRALVDSAGRAGEAIVMLQNTGAIPVACLVANQEAVRITGYSQEELKKISWLDLVHPRFREESHKRAQARLHNDDIPGIYEISLVSKYGVEIPVEVTGSPVQYQGRPAIVGFFREITERKQAELEREAMITELKAALANIKQLKGLIPICASCKKIRNDGGYWQQVEEYVADHSDADFSHGLCDECAHNLYPDYFPDKKNEENIPPQRHKDTKDQ